MKKLLFSVFAFSATATAMAQSSVTLYGIVDNGIVYETNQPKGHVFGAQSGGWAQSRFGLKGAEDLGGGTHAIFQLESRLNTMNGTFANGSFFEGQATVGLQNDTWGQIKFGNMGSAEISQYSGDVDPQQTKKYAIGTLVRGRIFSQAANGAEYLSPTIAGFTLQGQYDLTNSPTLEARLVNSAPLADSGVLRAARTVSNSPTRTRAFSGRRPTTRFATETANSVMCTLLLARFSRA